MSTKTSLSHRNQEPENSVLYLVGTPIGNLDDISLRAIKILKNVSLIACEDTRQTIKLMNKLGIKNKLISFNDHNSCKKIPKLINDLKEGKSIALVSDAGMPIICDPGEDLVKNVKSNGIDVICIPGPSAALTALVSSGMASSSFNFEGFLPKKKNEREKILFKICESEKTTVLFESPHRLNRLLEELKEFCGGDREIQVSRELTKKFEENIYDNIYGLIETFRGREIIGEITVVIKARNKLKNSKINEFVLKKELNELITAGLSLSAASSYLAKKKNLKKSIIYNLH
ncbi:16S rRNA (cytidine(1402)-2'-O)-methyltransferase [Prochlorococcus marinus XMU1411]|uniref:16S rRNA (cytidine(1402)-2'-O)-methyltransferase n=1 Tax=Prochlorococcus marinus TaxID=1219 RepID=UPI001ADAB6EC|nr:16S rRNA (cytidine(1402)-2'-O)-methyltransferase [Prochlorococcus marinus]MBO8244192.1 16S rRNA (cytidine(1402)-2'-O)-methyltransferase [Prochlorococcus marinus XMU1411]MBW3055276.1 16S rRNA (cytidine(1402)-2'-O)-methyltransferase [Prochlorococcus marinus str. MU1411]MCR8537019.1 16S rRNA (cytidine(1402)-2'-O)-methyltransferase [Prochlorococcus marinus CUG1430]